MEDTMISQIARLRNGPLILKNAMLMKKEAVMLSKKKNFGAEGMIYADCDLGFVMILLCKKT